MHGPDVTGRRVTTDDEQPRRHAVGLLSGILKAGIAKKVFDEARKPQNQQKAKQLFQQARSSRGGRSR